MSNMASNDDKLAGKGKGLAKDEDDGIVYVKFSIKGLVCMTLTLLLMHYGSSFGVIFFTFFIEIQDGRELFFKVNQDKFLVRAFRKYCEEMELEYHTMHFMLDDGQRIRGERQTPKMVTFFLNKTFTISLTNLCF